jgi:hypothetical protein
VSALIISGRYSRFFQIARPTGTAIANQVQPLAWTVISKCAGGITEGRAANASTDDLAKLAGHADKKTTAEVHDSTQIEAARRTRRAGGYCFQGLRNGFP